MSWYVIGTVKIWSFCMMKQLPPFWMNISATITNIMCKEKEKIVVHDIFNYVSRFRSLSLIFNYT